eukprot:1548774-Amphidinium_carterae.1
MEYKLLPGRLHKQHTQSNGHNIQSALAGSAHYNPFLPTIKLAPNETFYREFWGQFGDVRLGVSKSGTLGVKNKLCCWCA